MHSNKMELSYGFNIHVALDLHIRLTLVTPAAFAWLRRFLAQRLCRLCGGTKNVIVIIAIMFLYQQIIILGLLVSILFQKMQFL